MNKKDLEEKFKIAAEKANAKIAKKLATADKAIAEAVEISEKYGVPFRASPNGISNNYTPESYYEKWEGLTDTDENGDYVDLYDLCGGYANEYGAGWEHSAAC